MPIGSEACAIAPMAKRSSPAAGTGPQDRTARLWDIATGKPRGPALSHQGAVATVAFGPDGRTVLTGSDDGTARLWDAATGKPLGPALAHRDAVQVVAFSPDGQSL